MNIMTLPSATPGQIIIARHGEPDLDRYQVMDWRGYERWWAQYDLTGLKAGQIPPEALCSQARQARTIFASTLPRAIETARAFTDIGETGFAWGVETPEPVREPGTFFAEGRTVLLVKSRKDTGKIFKRRLRDPYWAGRDRRV